MNCKHGYSWQCPHCAGVAADDKKRTHGDPGLTVQMMACVATWPGQPLYQPTAQIMETPETPAEPSWHTCAACFDILAGRRTEPCPDHTKEKK